MNKNLINLKKKTAVETSTPTQIRSRSEYPPTWYTFPFWATLNPDLEEQINLETHCHSAILLFLAFYALSYFYFIFLFVFDGGNRPIWNEGLCNFSVPIYFTLEITYSWASRDPQGIQNDSLIISHRGSHSEGFHKRIPYDYIKNEPCIHVVGSKGFSNLMSILLKYVKWNTVLRNYLY